MAARRPRARWLGDARIALNINLTVEAGGERSILEGDGREIAEHWRRSHSPIS
jgi:hypothetical protein